MLSFSFTVILVGTLFKDDRQIGGVVGTCHSRSTFTVLSTSLSWNEDPNSRLPCREEERSSSHICWPTVDRQHAVANLWKSGLGTEIVQSGPDPVLSHSKTGTRLKHPTWYTSRTLPTTGTISVPTGKPCLEGGGATQASSWVFYESLREVHGCVRGRGFHGTQDLALMGGFHQKEKVSRIWAKAPCLPIPNICP